MASSPRPAVHRIRPPKAPYRVVNRVLRWLLTDIGHRRAGRRMGIRITVPRTPTRAELAEAARRDGLALVRLDLAGTPR